MNRDDNKSLVNVNENSIFYKVKCFFKNLFSKNNMEQNVIVEEKIIENNNSNSKNDFIEKYKNIANEESKLLKLQQQYENGQIKEEDLSEKQLSDLEDLYNKQNAELFRRNVYKIKKIKESTDASELLKKVKNIEDGEVKLQQQLENNEISEEQLTEEQKNQLLELYEDQNYWLERLNTLRKEKILQYKNKRTA